MQRPKIDQYFAKKGIKVYYNTLGHTEELVKAYVAQFKPLLYKTGATRSQNVKQSCYENLYPVQPREKKTGFENLDKQDRAFRERIVNDLTDIFYGPTAEVIDHGNEVKDYKTLLVSSLKELSNPVIYLSGGIDSEIVAYALLESKNPFKCVLFRWLDETGMIVNQYEIEYAEKFCKEHGLTLDITDIDVETLWKSNEFADFARDIQIQSTHQLTHAWVVSCIEDKYPKSTHLFGGEVRFFANTVDDSSVNIVFLDKVNPPAYSGGTFLGSTSGGGTASCTLRYNNITGGYTITGLVNGSSNTGTWTTTPGSSYEYQITNVVISSQFGTTSTTPASWPTSWSSINSSGTIICRVETNAPFSFVAADFYIDVRVIGETSPVVSSIITMSADGIS